MNIGDKLRSLRLNTKRTLKEQSDILGVSLNSVYRWENNLAVPRKSMLTQIAELHNVPLEWLLHANTTQGYIEYISNKYINNGMSTENDLEMQLLILFRNLSENNKHKVLGLLEGLLGVFSQ